jgi:ATP-dependent Lon protease
MQESARTALGFLRAHAPSLGLEGVNWDETDVHVHVPEGAIPKDGPSAGVTLALSMLSALSGRRVRRSVAMTGEITLRGEVLPIGGVREKILAAKRLGILEVIVPEANRVDVEELPPWVRKGMEIRYAGEAAQVFALALLDGGEA